MRCWSCGVEPEMVDVSTVTDAQPRYISGRWPTGDDHEHAERPPTPGQLEQAGHEALMRIRGAAA
jgi:hypothetical protein